MSLKNREFGNLLYPTHFDQIIKLRGMNVEKSLIRFELSLIRSGSKWLLFIQLISIMVIFVPFLLSFNEYFRSYNFFILLNRLFFFFLKWCEFLLIFINSGNLLILVCLINKLPRNHNLTIFAYKSEIGVQHRFWFM
jgi:hypothetical protein